LIYCEEKPIVGRKVRVRKINIFGDKISAKHFYAVYGYQNVWFNYKTDGMAWRTIGGSYDCMPLDEWEYQ